MHRSACRGPAQQYIPERYVRRERGLVLLPGLVFDLRARQFPAPPAGVVGGGDAAAAAFTAARGNEAQLRVLLPVPVARQIGEAAETRLALAQRLLRLLVRGDVERKGDHSAVGQSLVRDQQPFTVLALHLQDAAAAVARKAVLEPGLLASDRLRVV